MIQEPYAVETDEVVFLGLFESPSKNIFLPLTLSEQGSERVWQLPGGTLEPKETVEALSRRVFKNLGLVIDQPGTSEDLIKIIDNGYPDLSPFPRIMIGEIPSADKFIVNSYINRRRFVNRLFEKGRLAENLWHRRRLDDYKVDERHKAIIKIALGSLFG